LLGHCCWCGRSLTVCVRSGADDQRRRRGGSGGDRRVTCPAHVRRDWSAETGRHVVEGRRGVGDEWSAVLGAEVRVAAADCGVGQ